MDRWGNIPEIRGTPTSAGFEGGSLEMVGASSQDQDQAPRGLRCVGIFRRGSVPGLTVSKSQGLITRFQHTMPNSVERRAVLNLAQDTQIRAATKISTNQFAVGTKTGWISVWDNSLKQVHAAQASCEYTALAYYEIQTTQGPKQFLVAGAIFSPPGQGQFFGLTFTAGGVVCEPVYVRHRCR